MADINTYLDQYLEGAVEAIKGLSKETIDKAIEILVELRNRKGRLFLLGIGGSAANCSHAVNDFRKIAQIETYAPTDNVSELTARTNDESFESVFIEWLKVSNLSENDVILVFSVGGGSLEKNISTNIVRALEYAEEIKAKIIGIVSRDGGFTKKVADACILVPVITDDKITPYAESLQALIWHAMVFSPALKRA